MIHSYTKINQFANSDSRSGFITAVVILKVTATLTQVNLKCKSLLNYAIYHKPNQNRMNNKTVADVCILKG